MKTLIETNLSKDQSDADWRKDAARRILNEAEAARYLGISRSWLRQLRQKGGGPAYHRLGRRVGFALEDLSDWLAAPSREVIDP